jgi:lipid-binding SYLF domain-containing protein
MSLAPPSNLRMRPATVVLLLSAVGCSQPAKSAEEVGNADRNRVAEELADADHVVREMNAIPSRRREGARCVAVVPSLLRGGLVVVGRHGNGVVSCRTPHGWSAPAFITITGGGAGFQIGVESSDIIMLVTTNRAAAQLFRSSFAVGADVSASAGPVGEDTQAGTDGTLRAEILSYARSRGLFAGAELGGALVRQDVDALLTEYGTGPDVQAILAGRVAVPENASSLVAALAAEFGPGATDGDM